MRLDELEEMMTEQPDDAETAIADLVSTANVEELARIAGQGRVHALKLRAITGLGQVGGARAIAVLADLLEKVNTPFAVGGTEQQIEHQELKAALIQSLARARRVGVPTARTPGEVAEFIESCRTGRDT